LGQSPEIPVKIRKCLGKIPENDTQRLQETKKDLFRRPQHKKVSVIFVGEIL